MIWWSLLWGCLLGVSFAQWLRMSRLAKLGLRREIRVTAALQAALNLLKDPNEEHDAALGLAMTRMADELETQTHVGTWAKIPDYDDDWPDAKLHSFVTDDEER